MTQSAFIDVVGLIVAQLQQESPVSTRIQQADSRVLPDGCTEAVNVFFESAKPQPLAINYAPVDWTANIVVDCYAKTVGQNTTGDLSVDQLMKKVYERLASDRTLGGNVFDIGEPDISAQYDAIGVKTGWMRMLYPVQLRTQNLLLELP